MKIYQATATIPPIERYGLIGQMQRAAVSSAANIVEGCARNSTPDYLHFLDIVYGSAKEAEYLVGVAYRLNYLNEMTFLDLETRYKELSKVLGSLILSLRHR
jgi:four helix bundle protein